MYNPQGTMNYYLNPSFKLRVTNTAAVSSNYGHVNGDWVNYFAAKATSGADTAIPGVTGTSVTPASITVP